MSGAIPLMPLYVFMVCTGTDLPLLFYVTHFRAYDQYSKTEPTYVQYYCLFINLCLLVHLPDMFQR
jgi:hypothetical protein